MANFDKLPEMGDDAFVAGFLNKEFGNRVISRLNRKLRVVNPNNGGTAKFLQDEEQIVLDLSGLRFDVTASDLLENLQIQDATTGGVATVSVRWGEIAGFTADSSMVSDNDPLFTLALTGTGVRYIYADITGSYSATTTMWTPSACDVAVASSVPANTSTHAYLQIGQAESESDGGAGTRVKAGTISNSILGNQGFNRNYYTSTDYFQHAWRLT